jgi:quercetin dioxygenase-like cupin family protein
MTNLSDPEEPSLTNGNGGTYGSTSGTDTREARAMIEPLMHFSLAEEIATLRAEEAYRMRDRNSRTLAKETDFRVLLSVLRSGAALDEQDGVARASLQVIEGSATLGIDGDETTLEVGDLAVVDSGNAWLLEARTDCAVVITFAFPNERAGV